MEVVLIKLFWTDVAGSRQDNESLDQWKKFECMRLFEQLGPLDPLLRTLHDMEFERVAKAGQDGDVKQITGCRA